jgi:hypothetical protein
MVAFQEYPEVGFSFNRIPKVSPPGATVIVDPLEDSLYIGTSFPGTWWWIRVWLVLVSALQRAAGYTRRQKPVPQAPGTGR